ncbi:FAD/NAD(P)-binding domain-containing protein [Trichodelitschia bisporula]|uniref:FAD/NAD(P)-binding domain-containing protein n=1 Tax=Trichodelitschia bisporula TaxID=703511 RepID=A0A6G1HYZ4_9PEZI|nr:FAD/NAD(P)-binding domain-containing protein [Trichodelitschia bisporula]
MSVQWGLPLLESVLPRPTWERVYTAANDPFFEPPDPGNLPTWNGATGELLKDIPLLRMRRVSRRKFRALCAEGIDVQYGKVLAHIGDGDVSASQKAQGRPPGPRHVFKTTDKQGTPREDYVTAHFNDGSVAGGSLLIGADGAQSAVRTNILGEAGRAKSVPYNAINLHVCYNDAGKALFVRQKHPIMTHAIHPDGYWIWISIQDVPSPDDPAGWTFQLQLTWKKREGEDPTSLEALKAKAQTFAEPFRSAFLWVPDDKKVSVNNLSIWDPVPWDDNRVTLVGDAAHPMTFQRGQGLNHGIADADVLVREIVAARDGEKTVEEALAAYQAEMVPRAGEEVRLSMLNTEMLHDWERAINSPLLQKGGHANVKK